MGAPAKAKYWGEFQKRLLHGLFVEHPRLFGSQLIHGAKVRYWRWIEFQELAHRQPKGRLGFLPIHLRKVPLSVFHICKKEPPPIGLCLTSHLLMVRR